MKRLIILFFPMLLFSQACEEENRGFMNEGTITAADLRKCACCGGWYIEIEEFTYRFYELPDDNCCVDLATDIPIDVFVDWHQLDTTCLGDEIIIDRIGVKP